jgi:hypothetical protein
MTYNEVKRQQLLAATTHRVYGHAVEFEAEESDSDSVAAARRPWIVIQPCFCLWDTADQPCHCRWEMFWWLSPGSIVSRKKSGQKDEHGKELEVFDVLVESTIMVESLQSVGVAALKGLGRNVTARSVRNLGLTTAGGSFPPPGTGTSAKFADDVKAWLLGKFLDIELEEIKEGNFWNMLWWLPRPPK